MRSILAIAFVVTLIACDNNSELKRSVFIPDPDAQGLPKYTEWGYNTFGAYYNRDIIVSNDYEVPVQIIKYANTTRVQLRGQKGGQYWNSGEVFTMTLTINNFHPTTYEDLVSLDKRVIDLSDDNYELAINDGPISHDVELLNGIFEFKRAQRLLVDGQPQEVILSGVFDLQAIIDGEPVSISEGRFDVGVGRYNFFVYE